MTLAVVAVSGWVGCGRCATHVPDTVGVLCEWRLSTVHPLPATCYLPYYPACPPAQMQENRYADLPYFIGLASMTIYVGAHRGLNSRQRQQISLREGFLAPVAASGELISSVAATSHQPPATCC